jgi:hypothetical protein
MHRFKELSAQVEPQRPSSELDIFEDLTSVLTSPFFAFLSIHAWKLEMGILHVQLDIKVLLVFNAMMDISDWETPANSVFILLSSGF